MLSAVEQAEERALLIRQSTESCTARQRRAKHKYFRQIYSSLFDMRESLSEPPFCSGRAGAGGSVSQIFCAPSARVHSTRSAHLQSDELTRQVGPLVLGATRRV